ncbi:MAG TPA: hypothetical protein VFT55_08395, partial [Planctomycetota bacterium]|nr:hypothetical protein [Planctomycetota bacterium]
MAMAAMVWVIGGFVQLVQLASPSGIAVPDAGRSQAAGAEVAEPAPAGESNAAAVAVAERTAAPAADRASSEPRVLQVRVCRAFCQRSWHYTGPLVVTAGDDVVAEQELINSRPLEVVAPAHAATLVFTAPGLSPAELAVDSVDQKRGAEVVMQPREQLLVEVHRPPAAAAATGKWSLAVQVHTGENGLVDDKGSDSVRVPFVAGGSFRWQASLHCGAVRVDLSGEQPALAPAEQRVLAIDFASVPTQRYRVVGPSPQLLAHCELRQQWGEGAARRFATMPLGPDGTCELVPLPDSRFSIGGVALRAAPGGDVVLLRPERELQGVGLVDGGGAAVHSIAFGSDGKRLSNNCAVHVAARELLQAGAWLGNSFLTAQQVPARALAGPADLVLVPVAADAVATGSLRVRVRGEPPAADVLAKLHLVARFT